MIVTASLSPGSSSTGAGTTSSSGIGSGLPPAASISSIPLLAGSAPSSLPAASTGAGSSGTLSTPAPMVPSLSTLLSTPLPGLASQPAVVKTEPLIISPALPPIPAKVVDRVQSGKFVEFKEFLADNVLLLQRLQELGVAGSVAPALQPLVSGSRLREVTDPVSWASCFLAFLATKVEHKETRELAAYGMIILQLASKHQGAGWRSYDRQFRQHQAAGADLSWADLSPSLMAATVLGDSSGGLGRPCSLCLSADHSREDCALASLESTSKGNETPMNHRARHTRQPRRPAPYGATGSSPGVCCRFNRGACLAHHCRFEHFCSNCQRTGHPAISCPEPKYGSRERRDTRSPPPVLQKPAQSGGKAR